jgi:hypothetical protein
MNTKLYQNREATSFAKLDIKQPNQTVLTILSIWTGQPGASAGKRAPHLRGPSLPVFFEPWIFPDHLCLRGGRGVVQHSAGALSPKSLGSEVAFDGGHSNRALSVLVRVFSFRAGGGKVISRKNTTPRAW